MSKFFLTVDTEIDKSINWSISKRNSFDSINYGLVKILNPLLNKYNIKSTFLLSPEVLEDEESINSLKSIDNKNVEFGTHLHAEFIDPSRELFLYNMAGKKADKFQSEYESDIEYLKLKNLTDKFYRVFQYKPLSYRSGRYAKSIHTNNFLIDLGYKVDSSITPGIKWINNGNVVDYSNENNDIKIINKNNKNNLICLPISIQKKRKYLSYFYRVNNDHIFSKKYTSKLLNNFLGYDWLRPAYNKNYNLIKYFKKYNQDFYVLMMHSNEITINTSPYTKTIDNQRKLISSLEQLFKYLNYSKITSLRLKDLSKIYHTE